MTLKVKVSDCHFQYQSRESPDEYFGAKLVSWTQIHYKLSCGWSKFPRILRWNGQNYIEGQGQWPHFQYQLRVSQNACLLQIWWFQSKSETSYHTDKPNFLEFWVKMAKMNLKVKVNDPHFQYHLRASQDACLGQIWLFQLKSVKSHCAGR